ncbi:helix-turn-helix transcriptional regulator [Inconstantimicrobium mannanitabidum]|uniref:DeoR family transcriptional regulator n=1 Tax=Inconstantimicrobium mannanitabidum TaxID=1604901 RepID=A0ACB5RBQ9_9CLOT|nr:YafY family protein [Clostridium sp. TW13]GKX66500.1 DeoR family transcriptional regulator [Clostridium sp. TW13]
MRSNRLLSILIIISQKGLVTGHELAEHFEVSLRTIYRDIEKISEAGVPIAATGGKGGGYYIMGDYNLNNIFFNKKEIEPLIAVMENLKFLFGKNPKFNDIVIKFQSLHGSENQQDDNLNINMSHFSMEPELREYLFLINKAIEESKLLEFQYINRRLNYEKRIIEPIQIQFAGGDWYIIGFCKIRNDYRKFKLVRVRNLSLGDSFEKRLISKEKLEKIFSDSYDKNSILVTLKFSNKIGAQLSEYFLKDAITALENGEYLVKDLYPDDEGLKKFILSFGDYCEVVSPMKLRKEMSEYIKNIYLKYND